MEKLVIAIDGPAGAGKSTVAQIVAKRMGFTYIDTGAMYRAVTYLAIKENIDVKDEARITRLAAESSIMLKYIGEQLHIYLNDQDITAEIRSPKVTGKVAEIAQIPGVRKVMLDKQRAMAECGGVVMDGRDIGTYVLPNADVKIFLTASISERARRRYLELKEKGYVVDIVSLEKEIAQRDKMDSERKIAPLIQASDAVLLDSTGLSIEEVIQKIIMLCEGRKNDI